MLTLVETTTVLASTRPERLGGEGREPRPGECGPDLGLGRAESRLWLSWEILPDLAHY